MDGACPGLQRVAWTAPSQANMSAATAECEASTRLDGGRAVTLVPALTLHWSVDEAAGTVTGLLRLEGAVGWLAVGVAASAEGMMTGSGR